MVADCTDLATHAVVDPQGNHRGCCPQHAQQMVNLNGWGKVESGRRTASLWSKFVQWARSNGMSSRDPSAAMSFAQAFGVDPGALMSRIGLPGPSPAPTSGPVGDELGGIPLNEIEIHH